MINKKGAEMTIGTLVVIVLAVMVLAFVAYGFGTGWTNLWEKIKGSTSTANVDTLKQACLYACTAQQTYEYCCVNKTIILETGAHRVAKCKDDSLIHVDCGGITCPAVC